MSEKPKKARKPPDQWWTHHHPDCGTQYRGCHPILCPKDQYEKTGVWRTLKELAKANRNVKVCRLWVDVTYDANTTDPESLATALDRLMETILSTPGITEDYGEPCIVGEFYPMPELQQVVPTLVAGIAALPSIGGDEIHNYLTTALTDTYYPK